MATVVNKIIKVTVRQDLPQVAHFCKKGDELDMHVHVNNDTGKYMGFTLRNERDEWINDRTFFNFIGHSRNLLQLFRKHYPQSNVYKLQHGHEVALAYTHANQATGKMQYAYEWWNMPDEYHTYIVPRKFTEEPQTEAQLRQWVQDCIKLHDDLTAHERAAARLQGDHSSDQ